MNDDKEKKFKLNMSFEEAMKKAATTKVDSAMLIEEKDKEYEITGAAGRKILFKQITIPGKELNRFFLWVCLYKKEQMPVEFEYVLTISPYQVMTDTCFFEKEIVDNRSTRRPEQPYQRNPLVIEKETKITVAVKPTEQSKDEDFEMCILYYDVLD